MSMLQIASTSLSRIWHWSIQYTVDIVDNFNVKTYIVCNELLFKQTNMVKT